MTVLCFRAGHSPTVGRSQKVVDRDAETCVYLVVANFCSDKCNVGVLRGSVEGVNVLAN